MLTLYQYEISPYADKVRRVLRLKGLAYAVVEVQISRPGAHKAISPTGKYPALAHEGGVIVDSSDILRWLDARYPEPRIAPDDPHHAGLATILEDWADEALYFYDLTMRNWPQNRPWFVRDLLAHEKGIAAALLGRLIPSALAKVTRAQGLGRKAEKTVTADLAAQYDGLESMLAGQDWLAGPRLSSADIAVRVMVNVLERAVEAKALLEARPNLAAWAARVDQAAPPEGLSITRHSPNH